MNSDKSIAEPIALYPASLRMQVVSTVILRQQPRRMFGITHRLVKIDDAVEQTGRAEERIDRFALDFPFRAEVARKRRALE